MKSLIVTAFLVGIVLWVGSLAALFFGMDLADAASIFIGGWVIKLLASIVSAVMENTDVLLEKRKPT